MMIFSGLLVEAWCTKLLVVCNRLLVGWAWCAKMVLLSSFTIPVWWEILVVLCFGELVEHWCTDIVTASSTNLMALAWWLSMLVFSVWCEVTVKKSADFWLLCPWWDNIEDFSRPAVLLLIWCETMLLKKGASSPATNMLLLLSMVSSQIMVVAVVVN